jgi:ABC-type amino acid transport substrate-binding protein
MPCPPFAAARLIPALAVPLALVALMASPAIVAAPLSVRHPLVQSVDDHRAEYPVAVLRLALEKAGVRADLRPAPVAMEQARAMRSLAQGRLIDVMWTVSTPERERRLRAVRIPIDRGLIGWRVLAVRRDALPRFAGVRDVGDLARLVGAQGHDWPDLAILRSNGLDTVATPSYSSLFELAERGRIDYVARGAGEALPELASRADLGLVVEPRLVLHYPSAMYFFVHPDNEALAAHLDRGLRRALADGSLNAAFERAYGADLAALDLARRHRLTLANPQLPAQTPLAQAEWWYAPGDTARARP